MKTRSGARRPEARTPSHERSRSEEVSGASEDFRSRLRSLFADGNDGLGDVVFKLEITLHTPIRDLLDISCQSLDRL
jgi:hypothetical protein